MTARSEEIEEEADYVNVDVHTVEKTGTTSDQKFSSVTKSLPPLAVCWVTLIIIMSLRIYFTSVMSENNTKQLKENITSLLAVNHNLTNLNHKLRSENEKLRQDQTNLTVQFSNLSQDYRVLESKIANVTEEIQNLTTQNQELERQKNNLTEKIQDMETKQNELNVSRAQWSIDAYCRKENDKRQCEPCQKGWAHYESSCFAINNAESADLKTWDEAREDCRGKISDLAVIVDPKEKNYTSANSWRRPGTDGYWIGLRAEDTKWKWVDGSDLTETSWMKDPPTDGHCAISVQNEGWKSVNCGDRKTWICGKKAVSV